MLCICDVCSKLLTWPCHVPPFFYILYLTVLIYFSAKSNNPNLWTKTLNDYDSCWFIFILQKAQLSELCYIWILIINLLPFHEPCNGEKNNDFSVLFSNPLACFVQHLLQRNMILARGWWFYILGHVEGGL